MLGQSWQKGILFTQDMCITNLLALKEESDLVSTERDQLAFSSLPQPILIIYGSDGLGQLSNPAGKELSDFSNVLWESLSPVTCLGGEEGGRLMLIIDDLKENRGRVSSATMGP